MLIQFISSFLASATFAILFNVPKRFLISCGGAGMVGWVVYAILVRQHASAVLATLVATFCVSILSQILARVHKAPLVVFTAVGIIPLVPGGLAYDTMLNFLHNDYNVAVQSAAKVSLLSGAIAIGLLFSEVVYRINRKGVNQDT